MVGALTCIHARMGTHDDACIACVRNERDALREALLEIVDTFEHDYNSSDLRMAEIARAALAAVRSEGQVEG